MFADVQSQIHWKQPQGKEQKLKVSAVKTSILSNTAVILAAALTANSAIAADNALPSWNDGPALGLPDTKVGAFTQALYNEAHKQGWVVISMKNDWSRIFAFDQ